MLTLKNIVKTYTAGDSKVEALRDVSVSFRESEFVAVLGQSGCGKTTMLNIIGGLDGYTSGDLVINGKSTKKFSDRDWDAYRNHSVGFVFQSYNLIPHQSVLSNVELALTLTGVPRAERRRRAVEALESVGLGDQLHKKPNQMSGGQMQRVAIARALVNDPDIVLADEPTGALDSETSVQIMDLLKKVAENRLVIMVTHNPELAEKYATRTVRLLDGKIISDSAPYIAPEENDDGTKRAKKPSMSFSTALSLSLNNLMTKKTRTLLTSFAGSIGIIGIALILALSSGATAYINRVQEETLSSYPLMLQKQTVDVSGILTEMAGNGEKVEHEEGKVYSRQIMTQFISAMMTQVQTNDIAAFKKHIEDPANGFDPLVTDIAYSYSTQLNVYNSDGMRVSPSAVFENMGMGGASGMGGGMGMGAAMSYSNTDVWQEMIDNDALLRSQYDIVAGRFPQAWDEVVLITTEDMEITDYALYSLGLLETAQLKEMFSKIMSGQEVEVGTPAEYTYEELLGLKYRLLVNTEYFEKTAAGWVDHTNDAVWIASRLADAPEIKVVGILCPSENAVATSMSGTVGYRHELSEKLIDLVNSSEIVKAQKADPETDVFTGLAFASDSEYEATWEDLEAYIEAQDETTQQTLMGYIGQMRMGGMSDEQILEKFADALAPKKSDATYEENLAKMGVSDLEDPDMIYIYPKDFASKDEVKALIDEYNDKAGEAHKINYTDYVGILMSSITTVINAISYILIAFVAISLVVSSIMIGIITYISVLERTKEIGLLRAVGASKRDVSRVFNAETLIVGFAAGAIGIGITLLILIPANLIIGSLTGISGLAVLPWRGAVVLVVISMVLTFIAGLIPSSVAAKKDPVEALRSE